MLITTEILKLIILTTEPMQGANQLMEYVALSSPTLCLDVGEVSKTVLLEVTTLAIDMFGSDVELDINLQALIDTLTAHYITYSGDTELLNYITK